MKKSERIFYMDFIRAIAVITILLTHYNAIYVYLWEESALKKVVFTWRIANLYIGDFGVSLFLIISGAALMVAYEHTLDIKTFYTRRFWSIYPMFWIAYVVAFMHSFYIGKGIDQSIPKRNIIFSILGMDGYLNGLIPTFYKVGEWFLGFIILFYLLFPLIRWLVCKFPVIISLLAIGLFCITNCFYRSPMAKSILLVTRLPEIIFGMLFVKYFKVKRSWACVGLAVLVANTLLHPNIDKDIQTLYIGIAAFVFLSYVAKYFEYKQLVRRGVLILSKYSYAIFLTHHYIIGDITSKFDLHNVTVLESYLLFGLCCFWIAVFSKLLYEANSYIVKNIKGYIHMRDKRAII